MKTIYKAPLVVSHILLVLLFLVTLSLPDERSDADALPFLCACVIFEILYIVQLVRKSIRKEQTGCSQIMCLVWAVLIAWELATAKYAMLSVTLFPTPQKVFSVFPQHWDTMLVNAAYSLQLLSIGYIGGIVLGLASGLVVGWFARLRIVLQPIAKVLAPIPPMVISPYVIFIMPTFRSAAIVLVGITIFVIVFLETIERVCTLDPTIRDLAKSFNLRSWSMIKDVLVPYVLPSAISGLKVYMILGFMMLMMAEMVGSTYGLGHWIMTNNMFGNYASVIAGFIEIGVIVVVLNWAIELIQKKCIVWQ